MAKKSKDASDKLKEGVSVQEIESFARKYTSEVFMILALIIATISAIFDFFIGAGWSILFAGVGAIISVCIPTQLEQFMKKLLHFSVKDKSTEIIVGIVRIVIAIFIPPIIFLAIGLLSGNAYHAFTKK